jgi:hypothetical protein
MLKPLIFWHPRSWTFCLSFPLFKEVTALLNYHTVRENHTNEERSTVLAVGVGSLTITQAHPSSIQLPFREKFQYSAPPPEFGRCCTGEGEHPTGPQHAGRGALAKAPRVGEVAANNRVIVYLTSGLNTMCSRK